MDILGNKIYFSGNCGNLEEILKMEAMISTPSKITQPDTNLGLERDNTDKIQTKSLHQQNIIFVV